MTDNSPQYGTGSPVDRNGSPVYNISSPVCMTGTGT